MNPCRTYKLSEVVERFCAMQFNDHRRGFKNFLVMAQQIWEELFVETLKLEVGMWVALEAGNPYPVLSFPENMGRFLGLYTDTASCGGMRLVKVHPSKSISVAPVVEKTCGCSENCGCGSACAEANSFSYTESTVTIDGADYIKKQWFEVCSNGDVIEWLEMPTKVYRSTYTSGEFSNEFSSDFELEMERYDVDTIKLQRRITRLETKPCGCVVENVANKTLLTEYCGCTWNSGEVVSRKEAAVTYRPTHDHKGLEIIGGTAKQYWMRFQPKGASAHVPVPAYCLKAFWDGLNYYSRAYTTPNPQITKLLLRDYNRSKINVVEYLNPVDWDAIQPRRKTRELPTQRYVTPAQLPVALPPPTNMEL